MSELRSISLVSNGQVRHPLESNSFPCVRVCMCVHICVCVSLFIVTSPKRISFLTNTGLIASQPYIFAIDPWISTKEPCITAVPFPISLTPSWRGYFPRKVSQAKGKAATRSMLQKGSSVLFVQPVCKRDQINQRQVCRNISDAAAHSRRCRGWRAVFCTSCVCCCLLLCKYSEHQHLSRYILIGDR